MINPLFIFDAIMKLRIALFALLMVFTHFANAETLDSIMVSGKVMPDSGVASTSLAGTVQLYTYQQGVQGFSAMVGADGNFSFKVLIQETTLFELKYKGYRLNLMLSPAEAVCKVVVKYNGKDARSM